MAKMDIPTRYSVVERKHEGLVCDSQYGMTKQSFAAECDINTIMKRYMQTGVAPGTKGVGRYGDFSQVGDYLEAQDIVKNANEQFKALPAVARERFKHDPAKLLQFVMDPKNREEAQKLGLLKDEVKAPVVVDGDKK